MDIMNVLRTGMNMSISRIHIIVCYTIKKKFIMVEISKKVIYSLILYHLKFCRDKITFLKFNKRLELVPFNVFMHF